MLWQEEEISSPAALKKAISAGKLQHLKGFGEKTIHQISESLDFYLKNKHKLLLPEAIILSQEIVNELLSLRKDLRIEESGPIRRKEQVISELVFVVEDAPDIFKTLQECEALQQDEQKSSPFNWRGIHTPTGMHIRFRLSPLEDMVTENMILTGPVSHLAELNILPELRRNGFKSEAEVYSKAGYDFIPPDIRMAPDVLKTPADKLNQLITDKDIRGILHAHSTYSDGQNSIREMVSACKDAGYEYFGITDHSKSSFFYANGLFENRVREQFAEIDEIRKEIKDFTIFKGIECDILSDGNLDYSNEMLAEFDFIVISVHSVLNMDIKTATRRLIKAIENPYSTILGHLTGRLLLRRQGYPLDMPKILDACSRNNVSIEINANPRRLDIDWSFLHMVKDKGIRVSINPDAHNIKGISDVSFGVMAARKGLITPQENLTSMTASELLQYFKSRIHR